MVATHSAVFGVFTQHQALEHALEQLKQEGFTEAEISVIMSHQGTETSVNSAKILGGTGAAIGGVLGWLAGAGMLTIPGIAAVVVLGPIGTALLAATALGGVGGIFGSFLGLGLTDEHARAYEARLKKGDAVVFVQCDEEHRLTLARKILYNNGAEEIRPERPVL